MESCDREEANTRILIHLQDALANSCTACLVRTVDTDVVVIIIGKFHALLAKYPAVDIWIAFGTGKTFTYIHIYDFCNDLGNEKIYGTSCFSLLYWQPYLLGGRGTSQHGRPGNVTRR